MSGLTAYATNLADPVAVAKLIREQKTRIEDLERALQLLRQHTAGCERCAAVQEEDAAKRLADL